MDEPILHPARAGKLMVSVPMNLIDQLCDIIGKDTDIHAYISGMVEGRVVELQRRQLLDKSRPPY